MTTRFDAIALTAVLMTASSLGWAQGAAATGAPTAAATAPAASIPPPSAPAAEAYSYRQEGRRDPFVSLLSSGISSVPQVKLGGLAGIATPELIVRGVMLSRGEHVALITGSDGKTYRAHAGDRLADGVIRSVTPSGIVIMQDVNDPLSLVKQREVRKGLRTAEDGK